MTRPDLQRLIELHSLLLQVQAVERASLTPTGDHENDSEHSYSLAMLAWFLAPHFPELDLSRLLRLALAHDVVEAFAGDTPAYGDQAALDTKQAREDEAMMQFRKEWADFPDMLACMEDYKNKGSAEAKFIYVLDKLQPPILHYLGGGESWLANGVTFEKFLAEKKKKIPTDSVLYPYHQQLVAFMEQHLDMFVPSKEPS